MLCVTASHSNNVRLLGLSHKMPWVICAIRLLHNWLSIISITYLSAIQLQSVFINSCCLPTHTAFPFPVPSVTVCWHSNIGRDSFFRVLLVLVVLHNRSCQIFLQIYKVTNPTRNSRNVAQHAVGLHYVEALWNVLSGIYGRFDSRLDSNANGRFAGP